MTARRASGVARRTGALVLAALAAALAAPVAAPVAAHAGTVAPHAGPGALHAGTGADPGADIAVSGVEYGTGTVSFLASARGLPAGTSLEQALLTVRAGEVELPARLEKAAQDPARPRQRGVVIVLDTSGSMAGAPLVAARSAAAQYARLLPADVRLGLVTIADHPTVLAAPTVNRRTFSAALARTKAVGKTSLYDAVRQAAKLLEKGFDADAQRRVVVLSDGEDTASKSRLTDVIAHLRRDRATADVVGFHLGAKGVPAARQLAAGTGGKLLSTADAKGLAAAFRFVASSFSEPVRVVATVPASLDGQTLPLAVEATIGGRRVTAATSPGSLHAAPLVNKPLRAVQLRQPPHWLLMAAAGTVFAALFLLLLWGLRPALARAHQRRRIGQIGKFSLRSSARTESGGGQANAVARTALSLADRAIRKRGGHEKMALELEKAGMALRPHEWTLLRVGVAIGAGIIGAFLMPFGLFAGLFAGWFGTKVYRTQRTSRRARKFAAQLPDALQLVVGSLQSGFSLAQAVNACVKDAPEPIGPELGRALAATRLGTALEDGLEGVAHRVGSLDLEWAVMTIRIQREVGGNLAEVLETAVATMRERDGLRRHVRALSAEGRMSAWVLTGMPIAVAAWMFLLRRDYLRPLYTELLGIGMLVSAVLMVSFGAWWMSRIIKVDV